jgi:hypothetical protein
MIVQAIKYQSLSNIKKSSKIINILSILLLFCLFSFAQKISSSPDAIIKIDMNKAITKFSSSMYGIFFEDINHAADGGLYAEATMSLEKDKPVSISNPLYLIFNNPTKVTPRLKTINNVGCSFTYECQPNSITVLRLKQIRK